MRLLHPALIGSLSSAALIALVVGVQQAALNPSAGVRYGPLVSSNVWYGRIG